MVVAVLDTGIPLLDDNGNGQWNEQDLSHPDLDDTGKIILGPDYVGDLEGVRDLNSHGTHVAGIAAAETNNGTGVSGVCWDCKLLIIQVFDEDGEGFASDFEDGVVYAVDYAVNNNVDLVINYSGGADSPSQVLEDAVEYARDEGIVVVASGGNLESGESSCSVKYPEAYSDTYSNVIAVAASDHNDAWSTYSCEGTELTVAAPGGAGSPFGADDIFLPPPTIHLRAVPPRNTATWLVPPCLLPM